MQSAEVEPRTDEMDDVVDVADEVPDADVREPAPVLDRSFVLNELRALL